MEDLDLQLAYEETRTEAGADGLIFAFQKVLGPREVLPQTFEASEKWPNLIHEPLDQGNCAGSWAFSTAGTSWGWAPGARRVRLGDP